MLPPALKIIWLGYISHIVSFPVCMYCIPTEDILPQRKHPGSWDEDKAYLTPEMYMLNSRKKEYYCPGVE
jgi:hypothetical protein